VTEEPGVVAVGLGYVGLTLTATLADLGLKVWGYERQEEVVSHLNTGRSHIFEPGIDEILGSHIGKNLLVKPELPESISGTVVICVSTPVGDDDSPALGNLRDAVKNVMTRVEDGTLLIVRSTVPVGTCRDIVLPMIQEQSKQVFLAACPERTIQGRALSELRGLPQVVGGLDPESSARAEQFWLQVTQQVTPVSSLEAAEMVKLVNNSHTDLIYSYGNEVAMIAHELGLDPLEVIGAANLDYPRPDLARPGFVGGPCLTKDPYLLMSSIRNSAHWPRLIEGARELNQSLPETVAHHFVERLKSVGGDLHDAKVLVCGFAYKGWPVTDDIRGSATPGILKVLSEYPMKIYGHDYMVTDHVITAMGATPVSDLSQGFEGAQGVFFVNEHPDYRQLAITKLAESMKIPSVVYDSWRMFDSGAVSSVEGVHYMGIGYG